MVLSAGCATPNSPYIKHVNENIALPEGSKAFVKAIGPEKVKFLGRVDHGKLHKDENTASMMYPGNTAGLFLVSVATHALASETIKESERSALQEKADKVLLNYQAVLDNYMLDDLMQNGIQKFGRITDQLTFYPFDEDLASGNWLVEVAPTFYLSQDHDGIALKNLVKIYSRNDPSKVVYQNIVEVYSAQHQAEKSPAYWVSDSGKRLKDTSESLFAASVDLVVEDVLKMFSGQNSKQKTIKYDLWGKKMYERGILLSQNCDRMVIKTLRGWIKSVPTTSNDTSC
jgi:hypothetical protein